LSDWIAPIDTRAVAIQLIAAYAHIYCLGLKALLKDANGRKRLEIGFRGKELESKAESFVVMHKIYPQAIIEI